MSDTQLQEARRAASELARLQQAAATLPHLEERARQEAALAEATQKAGELEEQLDAALAELDGLNTTTSNRLLALIGQMCEAIDDRRRAHQEADQCYRLAEKLATVQYRKPSGPVDPTTHVGFMQSDIGARSQQILINKGYRGARLLSLIAPHDPDGQLLVELISKHLTHDFVEVR